MAVEQRTLEDVAEPLTGHCGGWEAGHSDVYRWQHEDTKLVITVEEIGHFSGRTDVTGLRDMESEWRAYLRAADGRALDCLVEGADQDTALQAARETMHANPDGEVVPE